MSIEELIQFKTDRNIVLAPRKTPIGFVYCLLSGDINHACPSDMRALNELLAVANGVNFEVV